MISVRNQDSVQVQLFPEACPNLRKQPMRLGAQCGLPKCFVDWWCPAASERKAAQVCSTRAGFKSNGRESTKVGVANDLEGMRRRGEEKGVMTLKVSAHVRIAFLEFPRAPRSLQSDLRFPLPISLLGRLSSGATGQIRMAFYIWPSTSTGPCCQS